VEVVLTLLSAFLAVKGCSNDFRGCFRGFFAWSFSMLLSLRFLVWGQLGKWGLKLMDVDGAKCLD
jgi:hypothetical protein